MVFTFRTSTMEKAVIVIIARPGGMTSIPCVILISLSLFSGPLFVVVEFAAHGNLRQFLQERRPGLEYHDEADAQTPEKLTLQDLLSFCYQVSKGMEFLSSRKVNKSLIKCSLIQCVSWLH